MNAYLSTVLGSKTKTASTEPEVEEIDLSKISAAEFLAGVEDGSIVVPEQEKVAEQDTLDLSKLTNEQLAALQAQLEKTASPSSTGAPVNDIDLNELTPAQIIDVANALIESGEGVEKVASGGDIDLNDLTVDEFLDFAEGLEEALIENGELEKQAGKVSDALKRGWEGAKGAGSRYGDLVTGRSARADISALSGKTGRGKASSALEILRGKWGSGAPSASGKGSRRSEAMKALGTMAGTAGVVGGGTAAGTIAYRRRKKK